MTTRKSGSNPSKPRIADYSDLRQEMECLPTKMVSGWFEYALSGDAQKPSFAVCKNLARAIQVAINRINNREKQENGPVDLFELKDADSDQWLMYKMRPLLDAGHKFILAAEDFEKSHGNYHWEDAQGSISLLDIVDTMLRIGAHACVFERSSSGRPREAWHAAAREVAPLIERALREVGQNRNLRPTNGNSPVAIIGAEVINRAYGIGIEASAFATAMRNRKRSKTAEKEVG